MSDSYRILTSASTTAAAALHAQVEMWPADGLPTTTHRRT